MPVGQQEHDDREQNRAQGPKYHDQFRMHCGLCQFRISDDIDLPLATDHFEGHRTLQGFIVTLATDLEQNRIAFAHTYGVILDLFGIDHRCQHGANAKRTIDDANDFAITSKNRAIGGKATAALHQFKGWCDLGAALIKRNIKHRACQRMALQVGTHGRYIALDWGNIQNDVVRCDPVDGLQRREAALQRRCNGEIFTFVLWRATLPVIGKAFEHREIVVHDGLDLLGYGTCRNLTC